MIRARFWVPIGALLRWVPSDGKSLFEASEMTTSDTLALFAGNANPGLAQDIARHLQTKLGDAEVAKFSDGECRVELMENARGRDVFVIQPTCPPTNDTLMELLVMVDALRRASAARIT